MATKLYNYLGSQNPFFWIRSLLYLSQKIGMVKHIVCWKLKEKAEGNSAEVNAILIREKLLALKGNIKELKDISVGINAHWAADDNYEVVLETVFDTKEDLKAYAVHPSHLEAGSFIKKVYNSRVAVDYEF